MELWSCGAVGLLAGRETEGQRNRVERRRERPVSGFCTALRRNDDAGYGLDTCAAD